VTDGRLCVVLDVWAPARGGLEAYALALVEALVTRGAAVTLVCGTANAPAPAGTTLLATESREAAFYREADRLTAKGAHGRVLTFRHPGASADVFLPLGGLFADTLAARRRSEPWPLRWPRRLARALSARTRAFLDRERTFFTGDGLILASSPRVRAEIIARFPGFRGRVEVTGLPVDETRFRLPAPGEREAARRELGLGAEETVLLWIGNDPVRKGLAAARAVLRRLHRRKLDAHLVLAGHGSAAFHRREPGLVGLGHVGERVASLYHAADLLLQPSLEDNLSFSVLEALATGLPVVTTRDNGAAYWVSERDVGRVVDDARDVHALDGATLALLERGMLADAARQKRRLVVADCFASRHFAEVCGLLLPDGWR
jgi:UDP-glucose:(heptosyl)LPS alpha-1,3-glucosyltransferase